MTLIELEAMILLRRVGRTDAGVLTAPDWSMTNVTARSRGENWNGGQWRDGDLVELSPAGHRYLQSLQQILGG